ncbi:response regulator [Sphingobacterium wenxiniae]|uniref:DNA-binding response regulator, NarL/FixJ family, contains REC and HTH domains n=1 Tax=Sphingobacterium wenxiniae TaxID=683125 RepID=A0A1I6VWW7_9SPHI|nr:response regulator transcription factor [Sphingobacterium wenxiniae]SFT18220.1 DNA-binding response regulator, NarL/FixJ family, contains REC and HTH domains [Sphingobacterium wenxiniae]
MIRLVIIDDHRLFVDGIKAILQNESGIKLVNGYDDSVDIHKMLDDDKPDVVVVDMYMPRKSGIMLSREIKSYIPKVKFILLSMEVDSLFVAELESIGVEAYLSKELDASKLIDAIKRVYAGEVIYQATSLLSTEWPDVLSDDFHLTDREIEVLEYIKRGKTNKEIAELTNRSVWTIMTHRRNIRNKIRLLRGSR